MSRIVAAIAQLSVTTGLLAVSGCWKPATPPASPPRAQQTDVQPEAKPDVKPAARPEVRLPAEMWDVYLMQGKRIGYGHTTVQDVVEEGRKAVRIESLCHLAVKRDGQMTKEDIRSVSVETPQGKLLRFENEMHMGPKPIRTTGKVEGDRLVMQVDESRGSSHQTSIAWPAGCEGPYATEQTLIAQPMQPGDRRAFQAFLIGLNQVGDIEMVAKDFEATSLGTQKLDLLRIQTTTRLAGGQRIEGTVWANRAGETLKTSSQAMGLETYRATKAEAMAGVNESPELDLMTTTMVKVARRLKNAPHTREVRYRVRLQNSDPATVFATGPSQSVRPIDARTAEITVYAIRPGETDGNRSAPADPPTEGDRSPNRYIQSDDPVIVADARQAAGGQTDLWRVAVALERYVHREVKTKDYSQAFATASEVARSLEGDCTEHAVFLAALARACGIPARVTVGLVYMENRQAFGYHMWNELHIGGRWVPLDGTFAAGGVGADHLKITQTNLDGVSAYSTFLPVMEILGQLSIEVLDVK